MLSIPVGMSVLAGYLTGLVLYVLGSLLKSKRKAVKQTKRLKAAKQLIKTIDKINKGQKKIKSANKKVFLLITAENPDFVSLFSAEMGRQELDGAWPGDYEPNAVLDSCLSLLTTVIKIKHKKKDWEHAVIIFFTKYLDNTYSSYWMLRRAEDLKLFQAE